MPRLATKTSLGFVALVAATAACFDADLDALQSGRGRDAGAGDDAASADDGASAPATVRDAGGDLDGDVLEGGGAAGDAGHEASTMDVVAPDVLAADARPAGFCASLAPAPKLCEDFDEGAPVGDGWTLLDVTNAPPLAIDTSVASSAPGSLLSALLAADGAPASARLEAAVPVLSPHVHAEFQMLLSSGGGPFELFAIHEVADQTYGIFYKEEGGALLVYVDALADDGSLVTETYPLSVPPATWLHVEIDVDISDAATLTVKHDGAVVVSATNLQTSTHSRQQLFAEVGLYSATAATAQVNVDDVVVDWP